MTESTDTRLARAEDWCRDRGIPTRYAPNVLDQIGRTEVVSARATGSRVLGCYPDSTPYEHLFLPEDMPPDGPVPAA